MWCHKVTEFKAGLLTLHFRSSEFCGWEKLLLVHFDLFSFRDLKHAQEHILVGSKKKIKNHNMSPLNTIVSSKNSVGFWFHSEHKHMLRFTVFTVKRWFDQKDNIGQTSVIDVHLRNVFKLFYMENNLRQQLWNKQMPVFFFFHSPYSSQCGRKACESAL